MRNTLHFSPEECCHPNLRIVDYCQLRCRHCYLRQGSTTMPMDMGEKTCRDFITGSLPTRHRRIILNGGDAALHPDFSAICQFVQDLTGTVVFSSNGILIKRSITCFIYETGGIPV